MDMRDIITDWNVLAISKDLESKTPIKQILWWK